ncbi:hypothetical protein PR202_ga28588 [Eleusine coracana subsp. coracana]|uniref:F-box domain-containing protein n=1 Tax=Eleusine coracana subsp. coracana TaxID=191504 RepID=A0AAV5DJ52_ELECO|nr:hypothetical protein PR202_ga28588 [Eleusine coracana subsp. coracana]
MADRNRKEPTARQNLVERRRTTSFASAATVTRSSSTFPQSAQPNPRSRRRMALPPPPAALPDEIVEEALVRCSPEDPARLFRAALVCKPWCRLVSGRRFRRRYREFHHTPAPMLGFIINLQERSSEFTIGRFVSRSSFRPTAAACARSTPATAASSSPTRPGGPNARTISSPSGTPSRTSSWCCRSCRCTRIRTSAPGLPPCSVPPPAIATTSTATADRSKSSS